MNSLWRRRRSEDLRQAKSLAKFPEVKIADFMRKCINQLNESIYQIFRRSILWWGHLSEVEDVKTVHICDKLNSQHKQLNAQ